MFLRLPFVALVAAALAAGCNAPSAPKTELPPITPIMMPPPPAAADDGALAGRVWAWQRTRFADARVVTPDAPDRYTLEFSPDGRVQLRADCNRGGARYEAGAGRALTFSPAAVTKMGCPRGSQGTEFLRQLSEVAGYRFDAGNLELALRAEAGAMVFAPLAR